MLGEAEIEIAKKLFAAWSSGDPDAPAEFLTDDAVLHDIVAGSDKVGWPAIREFFNGALTISRASSWNRTPSGSAKAAWPYVGT
jgi:ketosteroid isomerase-like protein